MPTLDEDKFSVNDGNWNDNTIVGSILLSTGVKNYTNTSDLYDQCGSYRTITPIAIPGMEHEVKFNTTTNAKIKVQIQDTPSFFHLDGFGAWINDFGAGIVVHSSEKGSFDTRTIRANNPDIGDSFGTNVATSGDILVVGSPGESGPSNATLASGAAYVYKKLGSNWYFKQILRASNLGVNDNFGTSVSISGNRIVVGAHLEDGPTDILNASGAAYVFITADSGETWTEETILRASDASVNSEFGSSVKISGTTIVVGAPGESTTFAASGAVYVFFHNGSVWTQQQKLKASNAGASDLFGSAVSVSGDILVAGSPSEDGPLNTLSASGAAYAFTRSGSVWTQRQILRASNADPLDSFGVKVDISANTIIVAASGEDGPTNTTNQCGAAYVFVTTDGGLTWTQQQILRASNLEPTDSFGSSVAIQGNSIVVGASGEDGASNLVPDGGAVYLFTRTGLIWTEQRIERPSGTATNDFFGTSVSLNNNIIIAGAIGDDGVLNATSASGAGYIIDFTNQSQLTLGSVARPISISTTYILRFIFNISGTISLYILGGVYAVPTLVATSNLSVSGNYLGKAVRLSINVAHSGI